MDRQGEVLPGLVQKVLGICEAKNGTETDGRLQAGADGHPKRMATCWMLKRLQVLEDGGVATKEARNWRIEGPKRRITRMEYQRPLNKFEMEGCIAQKRIGQSR